MWLSASSRQAWRGVFLALTLVAVSMRLLAPPGFMTVAAPSGLRLVICTGHGPVQIGGDRLGDKAPASGAKADPPCLFAGAAAAPTPDAPHIPTMRLTIARVTSDPARRDLTGPVPTSAPPPARGPPGE